MGAGGTRTRTHVVGVDAAADGCGQVELAVAAVVAQDVRDVAAEAAEHAEAGEQPAALPRHRSGTRPLSARRKRPPPPPRFRPARPTLLPLTAPACAAESGPPGRPGSGAGAQPAGMLPLCPDPGAGLPGEGRRAVAAPPTRRARCQATPSFPPSLPRTPRRPPGASTDTPRSRRCSVFFPFILLSAPLFPSQSARPGSGHTHTGAAPPQAHAARQRSPALGQPASSGASRRGRGALRHPREQPLYLTYFSLSLFVWGFFNKLH